AVVSPTRVKVSPARELDHLASAYGIETLVADHDFSIHKETWNVTGSAPQVESLREYARLFEEEFSLYPPELVRRVALRRVILCEKLFCTGLRRAVVPDYFVHDIYVDVTGRGGHKLYQRNVIHHEFFHVINFADDGLRAEDERWASLNPRGFRYGTGGENAQ